MEITTVRHTSNYSTVAPVEASQSPEETQEQFLELLGGLSKKMGHRTEPDQAQYLAGLFVAEPRTSEIAQKTAQHIQRDQAADPKDSQDDKREVRAEVRTHDKGEKHIKRDERPEIVKVERKTEAREVKQNNSEQSKTDTAITEKITNDRIVTVSSQLDSQSQVSKPITKLEINTEIAAKITQTAINEIKSSSAAETPPSTDQLLKNIITQLANGTPVNEEVSQAINNQKPVDNFVAPSAPSAPSAIPVNQAATLLGELARTVINEVQSNNRFAATSAVEAIQKVDAGQLRQKEFRESAEVLKESRPQLSRKEIAQTVQKVEEAIKEALASKDGKTVSIRLDPPDLGTLKVDVTVKDGNLYARIVADSAHVASFLKEKGIDLQQMLRKLGLNVDQVNVFVGQKEDSHREFGHNTKNQSNMNSSVLRLVTQDGTGSDHAAVIKSYLGGGKGLENGWIA